MAQTRHNQGASEPAECSQEDRDRAASRRRALDRDLQQSETRYRLLYDLTPIMMKTVDTDSRIVHANASYLKTLGYTLDEVLGRKSVDFLTPESAERVMGFVDPEVRRHGVCRHVEVQMVTRSGDIVDAELSVAAQLDDDGNVEAVHSAFINISDRKQAERLRNENSLLQQRLLQTSGGNSMIGKSEVMVDVIRKVRMVAATDSTVLVTGETGTGKEVVARAIHELSSRKDRMMVSVNCGALPANLVESELFGHEKGAFTGATSRKVGRFETAHRSTLFLDEVGELPLDTQTRLLRVLQEQVFERVGGTSPITVDVRVIAATNRDLEADVKSGRFRADLYFRLNIFPIRVPPLRERRDDIAALAEHFIQRYAERMGRRIEGISPSALADLARHQWPGNVRELANVLERAIILCPGSIIQKEHIVGLSTARVDETADVVSLEEMERRHIRAALEATGGVVAGAKGAAGILKINRSTLDARMRKLGIRALKRPPYHANI